VTASISMAVAAYQPWFQPVQDCCVRSGILWDLAAVYAPGSIWSERMPPATVFVAIDGLAAGFIGVIDQKTGDQF
jgi:hypothetical protein